jgi:hypothetical protein
MKKQTYLNRTQINALVERSITIYNEKAKALSKIKEKETAKREAEYKSIVTDMLRDADISATQLRDVVDLLVTHNDGYGKGASWSIDAIVGKSKLPDRSEYDPKGWRKENHPLHKVLEQMRFELVMAPAADFEKHIAAMVGKIDAMFKEKNDGHV